MGAIECEEGVRRFGAALSDRHSIMHAIRAILTMRVFISVYGL